MSFIELSSDISFLVVDDGPNIRETLASCLKTLGYKKIFQSQDGLGAIETMKRENVGFVICNRNLMQMSGMELLKEIRETPELARAPFMMMAAEIPKEDVILASEFGVDGYLKIPFVLKDVSARISACMARYRDAKNLEGVYDQARVQFMNGEYKGAIANYEKVLAATPTSARVRVGMARCYRGMGDLPSAEKWLKDAIGVNSMYVHAHHELGLIYLQQDKVNEALQSFDKAINLSPSNPIRYETIADILIRTGRMKEAEDYLMRAVKLELAYPVLYAQMGKVLFTQKKLDRASTYFQKALVQQPDNTSFLNSMGICMKELGRYEDAISYYNQALKYRPQDIKILFNKVLCHMQMNQLDRAKKVCQTILKIDPAYEKAIAKMKDIEKLETEAHTKANVTKTPAA